MQPAGKGLGGASCVLVEAVQRKGAVAYVACAVARHVAAELGDQAFHEGPALALGIERAVAGQDVGAVGAFHDEAQPVARRVALLHGRARHGPDPEAELGKASGQKPAGVGLPQPLEAGIAEGGQAEALRQLRQGLTEEGSFVRGKLERTSGLPAKGLVHGKPEAQGAGHGIVALHLHGAGLLAAEVGDLKDH